MRRLIRLTDATSELTGRALAYGYIPLTLIVFAEVVSRYVFNAPLIWAHETSLYVCGSIGVLAGAYTFLHHGHVRMDIIYRRFSLRTRAAIDAVMAALFLFYIIVLLLSTGQLTIISVQMNQHTWSAWSPPLYPLKIIAAIAVLLMLLQGLGQFMRDLFHAWRGRPEP